MAICNSLLVYDVLHRGLGLPAEVARGVARWALESSRLTSSRLRPDIFTKVDDETGLPLVDLILDEAKQKGTGKWASQDSLDVRAPIPTINAAVRARIISAYKEERVAASRVLAGTEPAFDEANPERFIDQVEDALYVAKICSYAQELCAPPCSERRV